MICSKWKVNIEVSGAEKAQSKCWLERKATRTVLNSLSKTLDNIT